MAGPIRIAILANAFQAVREMRRTVSESRAMGRALEGAGRVATAVRERIAGLATGLLKGAGALAQVASTAAALAPLMARAGTSIANVGKAFGNAAPALAAFAAAAVFIKLTMAQIGPALLKSLSPIAEGFKAAGVEAGKLASQGVAPLAARFNELGMPVISAQMNRIAVATNGVVKGFLSWASSQAGIASLRGITRATATAFEKVAPHVQALVTGLGEMIGRIAGVSLAAGSKGLVGILDKVTEKLKGINAHTVQKGFDDLKAAFDSVKAAVATTRDAISAVIGFYRKYETQIGLLSDAFAVFAIVFGGPVTAIVAAVGLIIRHFDTFKAAYTQVKDALSAPGSLGIIDQLRGAVQTVVPAVVGAFTAIKAAILPTLTEIFNKIRTEVVPAFADFVVAMAPVVAFLVERLGPIVATVFGTIVQVISGALDIVVGIMKVFTGILTGDWSKTWEGIKQILGGALSIVKSLISGALALIGQGFANARAVISGIWSGLWALVKDAASSAKNAVVQKAAELAIGLRNKMQEARNAVKQKWDEIVGVVRAGIQSAKNAITNIDLFGAGAALIRRLVDGIRSQLGAVRDAVGSVAGAVGGFFPGSPIKEGPLKGWNDGKVGIDLINMLIAGIKHSKHPLDRATSNAAKGIARAIGHAPKRTTPKGGSGFGYGCGCGGGITINFNGVVGDPVEVGREVEKVLIRYRRNQGRAA